METYKKVEWAPKETYDQAKNVIFKDFRNLVRTETLVEVLSPKELKESYRQRLKNYNSNAILKFKPGPERAHIYYTPLERETKQRRI